MLVNGEGWLILSPVAPEYMYMYLSVRRRVKCKNF